MASPYEALLLEQISYLTRNSPVLLQTSTLGSNQSSVPLTVPAGTAYNTLRVTWRARTDNAVVSQLINMRVNGISSSSYLTQKMEANNTTQSDAIALTTSWQIGNVVGASGAALYQAGGRVEIYATQDSSNQLTMLANSGCWTGSANGITGQYAGNLAGWNSTVTSVTLLPAAGNFVAGSVFSLYGEG